MNASPEKRKPRKLEKRSGPPGRAGDPTTHMMSQRGDRQGIQRGSDMSDDHDHNTSLSPATVQFSAHHEEDEDDHSMNEREMRRHFMDVESSFMPDIVPHAQVQDDRLGVDDTYLELGNPVRVSPPEQIMDSSRSRMHEYIEIDDQGEETPAEVWKTASTGRYDEDAEEEAEEEEGESHTVEQDETTQDASPMVAAAQRTHARNIWSHPMRDSTHNSRASTPSTRPLSKGSTVRPESSSRSPYSGQSVPETASFAGGTNGTGSSAQPHRSTRPNGLRSRMTSHHSSLSSGTISSDFSFSDAAMDLDYALQTDGTVANSSSLPRHSRAARILSRLPSMGSLSSYMDDQNERPRTVSGALPAGQVGTRISADHEDRPETPRARVLNDQPPTDTALAQRVESIQVPDTVARDFRAMNRILSPEKRPSSAGGLGTSVQSGPRKTLTLKEQNGKIDKLTKENFDLKLKIHFLDEALRSRSDDGVKELIDKNVQLQTDLANERKETQHMRRKMRELERKIKDQDERFAEAEKRRYGEAADRDDDDPTLQAEMHEEILYLRQQLDRSENQVTTLREEVMTKELEKRKMAEHMRSMAGSRGEDAAGARETMDMWQDLLSAETGRREEAEEDIRRLREELSALRIDRASPAANRMVKSIKRKSGLGYEQNLDDDSEAPNGMHRSETASSAILAEQLKHENAELRRDLGAQTSMLTSRNRERERLQQEIEDLKLLQRKSDGARSVTGESIFERSISRAHQRAQSRTSDHTQTTLPTEAERDDWDRKEGQLRDKNAELKLKFQELERAHNTHLQYIASLESDYAEMEQELNDSSDDNRALQSERDEALHAHEDLRAEYEKLEQEALNEIDRGMKENEDLEIQLDDTRKKLQKTQSKLDHTSDGYQGLQGELREITQSVMNLEDEKEANMRTIQAMEQQLADAEAETQNWESKCKELDQKNRKLEITQESLQSEVTFLREEQEGDKIKIGELDDALNAAQHTIQDEQERMRELEEAIVEERQQRDVLENNSREEVQKVLDDLNNESSKTKDDVRKLRRSLSAKEVEASSWKQKLDELEQDLRNALGDSQGTKQTLLTAIDKLQRDLETTANNLDRAKMDLADKDRLLRHRDGLLESTSLESRRLSDLLDKERSSRKHDLEQFEKASRGQATHMRTIAQQESRVLELETAYSQDKRKMAALESLYREQLSERNNLLMALWNRLSTICGADWAQAHSLVNGQQPSPEVIQSSLSAFSKNLISALKTIEALLGNFKIRIRSTEKDLWRDYQTLEQNLDMRVRRMEALESAVETTQKALAEAEEHNAQQSRSQPSRSSSIRGNRSNEESNKLKNELKMLKSELKIHRAHPSAMAQQVLNQKAQQLNPDAHLRRISTGGSYPSKSSATSPARAIVASLLRGHSSSATEQIYPGPLTEEDPTPTRPPSLAIATTPPAPHPNEARWRHRLQELERRLSAEREARLLDRHGARQRLIQGQLENEELRSMLEREKFRHAEVEHDHGSLAESEHEGEMTMEKADEGDEDRGEHSPE